MATVSSTPVGSAAVRGEERACGVHQRMQPIVASGDTRREDAHGLGIDDVELDGLDHGAGSEVAGLAGGGLDPPLVPADQPERGTETRQFQRSRLTDSRRGARHDHDAPGEVGGRGPVLEA